MKLSGLLLLGGSALFLMMVGVDDARAQYVCGSGPGPGERMVGRAPSGRGMAGPPLCVRDAPAAGLEGGQAPQSDPMQQRIDGLRAVVDMWRAALFLHADNARRLANNPGYRKLSGGHWTYYQEGEQPELGQRCAAAFMNLEGMLGITALGGYEDPALLLLSGLDVPSPREGQVIRATLHQTGERPQSVDVQNFTATGMDVGTIAFAIPSLEAVAEGLRDEAEIAVDVGSKRIYSLTYHGGRHASTELEKCAKAAG